MSFSSEAISLIDYIASKFGVAIDWSSENILPIVQNLAGKYITWEIFSSIAWIAIAVVFEIVLIVLIRNDIKKWRSGIFTVFGVFGVAILCIIALKQIFDVIRSLTFPELQIFQYLQGIMQTMK